MLRIARILLLPVALALVPTIAIAQRSQRSSESSEPIEQLSTGSYSSRQQATMDMWRGREQSRDQVQRAARHPDPEISGRAQWILRQWRRGSLPGTPPEITRLLAKAQDGTAINRLLLEGQFDAALVAVEESAGTLENEAIRQRVALTMQRRFPLCVRAALANNRLPQMLEFIDHVAHSKELAVCRIELMQRMGIDVDSAGLLPKAADAWTAAERVPAEALVLMILGRADQGIELAGQASDQELLHRCRIIAGRWPAATMAAADAARRTDPKTSEYVRLWSRALICADRAGDDDVFRAAVEALAAQSSGEAPVAQDLRWRTLASHGEIDAAFEILDTLSPETSALLSIDASRVERAFDVMQYPLASVDAQILNWVDAAVEQQGKAEAEELVAPINRIFALIRCLIAVGREDAARAAVARLCQSDVKVGALRLRDYTLSNLAMTRRSDWVIDFAVAADEKNLSPIGRSILAQMLPDADSASLEVVLEAVAKINRNLDIHERVAAACALMSGTIPAGFDPEVDFKELYDFVVAPRQPIRGSTSSYREIRANMNIVRMFTQHGQADYASACLRKIVDSGDLEALLHLAQQELDAGSSDSALAMFESIYESVFKRKADGRFGRANDGELAVQSLIGAWTIAKRIGDLQRADELMYEIRLAMCTPSTEMRAAVAQYLADRDQSELAIEIFEHLLPMAMFDNEEQTGIYSVARSYAMLSADGDHAEAARWFDLAICETIGSTGYRPGAYVTLPLYVRRWSVEAALTAGDQQAIASHLDRILKLDPLEIDLGERILPEIRKAGMGELADQAIEKMMDAGIAYSDQFPDDAMTSNNLAWVAAMNGVRLDEALRLSERAVYREPNSAIYRDTLAEVLFLLDRKQEALQVEEGCLLDDPTQWHLHQQVDKYRQAVTAATR